MRPMWLQSMKQEIPIVRWEAPSSRWASIYQKEHWITQEPWGGYVRHNNIYRLVHDAMGELVADELVADNHAIMMYPPMLEC